MSNVNVSNSYSKLMQKHASAIQLQKQAFDMKGAQDKILSVANAAKNWVKQNPEIAIGAGVGGVGGAVAGGAAQGFKGAVAGGLGGAAAGAGVGYGIKNRDQIKAYLKSNFTHQGRLDAKEDAWRKSNQAIGSGPLGNLPTQDEYLENQRKQQNPDDNI